MVCSGVHIRGPHYRPMVWILDVDNGNIVDLILGVEVLKQGVLFAAFSFYLASKRTVYSAGSLTF